MGAEGSLDYESEIVVQLGRLTITVRNPDREARRRSPPPPSAEAAEPSTGSADADDFILVPGPESSPSARASDEAFLAASTPRSLGSLGLGPAQALVGQLRGADSAWTPAARIARALRAGIGARRKLDGSEHYVNGSPALGLQNRIYICLRSAQHPQGFWTNSSQQYLEGVRCPSGDRFGTSVSHAFASRAESEAYLLGAGQRWPPQLPLRP